MAQYNENTQWLAESEGEEKDMITDDKVNRWHLKKIIIVSKSDNAEHL